MAEQDLTIFDGTIYKNLRDVYDIYIGEGVNQEFLDEFQEHFTEIRRRHVVLVMHNGANFILLKRKVIGDVCPYFDRQVNNCPKPLVDPKCYGTGWVGGYDNAGLIKIYFPPSNMHITWYQHGQRLERTAAPFTIWEPALDSWDVIVKQSSGEKFLITDVTKVPEWRGLTVMQELAVLKVTDQPVRSYPLTLV